jgi:hypothetical protein
VNAVFVEDREEPLLHVWDMDNIEDADDEEEGGDEEVGVRLSRDPRLSICELLKQRRGPRDIPSNAMQKTKIESGDKDGDVEKMRIQG